MEAWLDNLTTDGLSASELWVGSREQTWDEKQRIPDTLGSCLQDLESDFTKPLGMRRTPSWCSWQAVEVGLRVHGMTVEARVGYGEFEPFLAHLFCLHGSTNGFHHEMELWKRRMPRRAKAPPTSSTEPHSSWRCANASRSKWCAARRNCCQLLPMALSCFPRSTNCQSARPRISRLATSEILRVKEDEYNPLP